MTDTARTTPPISGGSHDEPETPPTGSAEMHHANATTVQAHDLTMVQSAAGKITTERATIGMSSVRDLDARSANLEKSSVFRLDAENAVLNQSATTFVRANEARLVKCNALLINGSTSAVEGDLKTVFQLGEATGNVHTIFDTRGAAAAGAGLGAVLLLIGWLLRKLVDR